VISTNRKQSPSAALSGDWSGTWPSAPGDQFIQNSKTLRRLQRKFSALATEMEGAAVAYTCGLLGIPFVIIRGISDGASVTADTHFKANLHTV
tara:strand:+ start:392 stop:670 length:279 start_codon:yes stop_codon:yes gene_type:complete